jgi:alanine racemase
MNLTVVRLPSGLNCSPGEEAVLLGAQDRERITAEELARQAGTIPYEIFCLLGPLNPRTYLNH